MQRDPPKPFKIKQHQTNALEQSIVEPTTTGGEKLMDSARTKSAQKLHSVSEHHRKKKQTRKSN